MLVKAVRFHCEITGETETPSGVLLLLLAYNNQEYQIQMYIIF